MLAEGFHSTADCLNQVMLLIGCKLSERPPDDEHPFGYGNVLFSSNSQFLSRFNFHTVTPFLGSEVIKWHSGCLK